MKCPWKAHVLNACFQLSIQMWGFRKMIISWGLWPKQWIDPLMDLSLDYQEVVDNRKHNLSAGVLLKGPFPRSFPCLLACRLPWGPGSLQSHCRENWPWVISLKHLKRPKFTTLRKHFLVQNYAVQNIKNNPNVAQNKSFHLLKWFFIAV